MGTRERDHDEHFEASAPFLQEPSVIQVVCIKQVADSETRVKIGADGKSLDPSGVTWILNPYDEFAVEQALRVKEKLGAGEVIAVSLGGAGVQATLRNVLAMGVDRAIHLKTNSPADPLQAARALAAAIRDLGAQDRKSGVSGE